MNTYEEIACGEYLAGYPNDKTYDEVMDLLLDDNDEVIVWEVFDRLSGVEIYDFIDTLRCLLEEKFILREEVK